MLNVNAVFNNAQQTNNSFCATSKQFCAIQAATQNVVNANKYTAQQLSFAYNILAQASNAFVRSKTYINLRNKYISVKVTNVTKACLASNAVNEFSKFIATQNNIVVKYTNTNSILFNIYF